MRYSMGFAGALLLAMSATLHADAIRDAGSKIRGDWWCSANATATANPVMIYRSYSVAPSAVDPAAPAPAPVAQQAQSNTAVRSYSVKPSQMRDANVNRSIV